MNKGACCARLATSQTDVCTQTDSRTGELQRQAVARQDHISRSLTRKPRNQEPKSGNVRARRTAAPTNPPAYPLTTGIHESCCVYTRGSEPEANVASRCSVMPATVNAEDKPLPRTHCLTYSGGRWVRKVVRFRGREPFRKPGGTLLSCPALFNFHPYESEEANDGRLRRHTDRLRHSENGPRLCDPSLRSRNVEPFCCARCRKGLRGVPARRTPRISELTQARCLRPGTVDSEAARHGSVSTTATCPRCFSPSPPHSPATVKAAGVEGAGGGFIFRCPWGYRLDPSRRIWPGPSGGF